MSEPDAIERAFHVPLEQLFDAFTTPRRLGAWLGAEAEVEPRMGGRYRLVFATPDRTGAIDMDGTVVGWSCPGHLAVTWAGDDRSFSLDLVPGLGGTTVLLASGDPGWWTDALGRLGAHLSRPHDR